MAQVSRRLFLASGSPRRKELMQQIGLSFEVLQAPVDELILPEESAEDYVCRIAIDKSLAGLHQVDADSSWIVGGDTAIIVDDKVMGKPKDSDDACRMLQTLSGSRHQVLSAVAVANANGVVSSLSCTQVVFKQLNQQEIKDYIDSGEPEGKAGAYAIQGLGACFIERIEGS